MNKREHRYNIRVTSCIDTSIYAKLEEYQEQYGYEDMSSTVRKILKEKFFGEENDL